MGSDSAPAVRKLFAVLMMAAGVTITVVFGGGLVLFLWMDIADLMRGSADATRLMSTLLVGPIVGGAPALLGLALVRMGWRRWRPLTDIGDEP